MPTNCHTDNFPCFFSFIIQLFTPFKNAPHTRRPSNIRLTWKTAPEGLGAARATVSNANGTSRDKGFLRLKRLLYLFDHVLYLYFNKTPFSAFPPYFLSLLINSYLPRSKILRILHLILINVQYSNNAKLLFSNG